MTDNAKKPQPSEADQSANAKAVAKILGIVEPAQLEENSKYRRLVALLESVAATARAEGAAEERERLLCELRAVVTLIDALPRPAPTPPASGAATDAGEVCATCEGTTRARYACCVIGCGQAHPCPDCNGTGRAPAKVQP